MSDVKPRPMVAACTTPEPPRDRSQTLTTPPSSKGRVADSQVCKAGVSPPPPQSPDELRYYARMARELASDSRLSPERRAHLGHMSANLLRSAARKEREAPAVMKTLSEERRRELKADMGARPEDLDLPDLLLDDPQLVKQLMNLWMSSTTDDQEIPSTRDLLELARAMSKDSTS